MTNTTNEQIELLNRVFRRMSLSLGTFGDYLCDSVRFISPFMLSFEKYVDRRKRRRYARYKRQEKLKRKLERL